MIVYPLNFIFGGFAMNRKFRKLLSGVISSVGVMSSLVCPCVHAKWGEGTHAMTDEEFNTFYTKVGVDALKYARIHVSNFLDYKKIDEYLDGFDEQNNLVGASFSEIMGKYCELYQSSLNDENKFSNCRVLSFMAIDYFQRNNIKSAYMQIGSYTFGGVHDVVIYEGKNKEWFVADLRLFFNTYCARKIKKVIEEFEELYGFKSTDLKYALAYPLHDYIDRFAGNLVNFVFTTENDGKGGYNGCNPLKGTAMFLPYWIKNSGACDKSFIDKFILNEGVTENDFETNAKKIKFISPIEIAEDPSAQLLFGIDGFVTYKGLGNGEVKIPLVL